MNNETPYHKVTLDVTELLPRIEVPADHHGLGIFLRRNGEAIGYFHHASPAGTVFEASALADLILARAGQDIIRSSLRSGPSRTAAIKPSLTVAVCTKDRAWSLEPCLGSLVAL